VRGGAGRTRRVFLNAGGSGRVGARRRAGLPRPAAPRSGLFQLNPAAVFTAVNILGWTLFFALACLFLAPLFLAADGTGASFMGALLLLNGVVCLLGLTGYLGRVRALNVMFFNGMGLAVLAFSLLGAAVL
jgi:hypothetical protein